MIRRAFRKGLKVYFRPSAYVLLILTVLLFCAGFVRVAPALIRVPKQIDFAAYYVAARMLNGHVNPYHPEIVDELALGIAGIQHTGYIYPPFFAALLRPLALLPYRLAEHVWFVINIGMFVALCLLLVHVAGLHQRWSIAILVVGVLFPAVYDCWLLGQLSILLSLLVVASLALALRYRVTLDLLAGIVLGLAVAIKVYPIILSAVYLRHRRWWVLLGMAIALLICVSIGLMFGGGWQTTRYWFEEVLPRTSSMAPFPSNQSLRGVVTRFFSIQSFQVPVLSQDNYVEVRLSPLIDSPGLSTGLIGLGTITLLVITGWFVLQPSLQRHVLSLDLAIGSTLMLMITPVVWDFYFVHLLLPLLLLFSAARKHTAILLAFAGICLLLAIQRYWRYMLLYVQSPWLMLSGFLAMFVMWVVLLMIRRHSPFTIHN